MSSINLERTCDATADSGYSKKWTFSAWVKRGLISTEQGLFANKRTDNNTNSRFRFRIKDTDKLCWEIKDSTGNDDSSFETNMLLRDTGAWYHIVFIYDSANSTESDRMKCYINGKDVRTELGGFSSVNEVGSNFGSLWSSSVKNYVGVTHDNSGNPFRWDGLMSHVHFTYGYRYEASAFGSTDATTGEWKINTNPSVTYGSQGFWLFKDNASVTDQSGQSNNYTLNAGTLTFTHDNPSNGFCNLNMNTSKNKPTLSLGNTKTGSSSDGHYVFGTQASKAGYYEIKLGQNPDGGSGSGLTFGTYDANFDDTQTNATNVRMYKTNHAYAATYSIDVGNGAGTNTSVSAAAGDIINVAWKNGKLYCGKNGTYFFSANPSNNTDGSTQVTMNDSNAYQLPISKSNVDGMTNSEWNFGNGYFGTTAVTSNSGNGYANANGQGKFQYQPPTGCYALCTKNLNV